MSNDIYRPFPVHVSKTLLLVVGVIMISSCGSDDDPPPRPIEPNQAPTANAGHDATENAGGLVTLDGSGSSDSGSGTIASYSWTQQSPETPTVALTNASAVTATFTAPLVTQDTTFVFRLTVTDDGGLTHADEVSMTINARPTAEAGDSQTVDAGDMVTLSGSGSDPGDGTVAYSWAQTSGPPVTLSANNVAAPTFIAPNITTAAIRLEFQLTVTDAHGLAHADSVSILIGNKVGTLSMDDHDGAVRGVSISRDGRLAVSGGIDGTVRLWNAETGDEIRFDPAPSGEGRSLGRHDSAVYAVAISADGNRAISGGAGGTVRLWDTAAGTEIRFAVTGNSETRSLGRAGIWVYAVALNKDGSRAASGGFDGKVRFWNTEITGADAGTEITYDIESGPGRRSLGYHTITDDNNTMETDDDITILTSVYALGLSDDGSRILSGGADGILHLWNTTTGTQERSLTDDDAMGPIYGAYLSGDGTTAVSGGADNNVHVWNADTGARTHELSGHEADVSSVSLNTAKTRVLSGGGDGTVRFWNVDPNDAAGGAEIHALRRHTDYVWSASLSGNSGIALSGSGDGTLNLWDTSTVPPETTEPFATTEPDTMPNDPDRLGDVASLELHDYQTSNVDVFVSLSADGNVALSEGSDNALRAWNAATGEILHTLTGGHARGIRGLALSSGGDVALSRSSDNILRLWDVATGRFLRVMDASYAGWNSNIALSADGRLALSGGYDRDLRLWDTTTGELLRSMSGHTKSITSVSLSASGHLALSASDDNTVRLWNTATGELLQSMNGHESQHGNTVLSADGRFALLNDGNRSLLRWDTTTGEILRDIGLGYGNLVLNADGRLVLMNGPDGLMLLRNTATGRILRVLKGHADWIASTSLSARGHAAISGSRDGTVRLWRIGRSHATVAASTATTMAGADQTVNPGTEVTLAASDLGDAGSGTPTAYFWRQIDGPTVTLQGADTTTATFTPPTSMTRDATLTFVLTVTDARGLATTDEVSVVVRASLTAIAGDDQYVGAESVVTLTGSESRDPGGARISYSWTQTSGPTVTLSSNNAVSPTFVAPAADAWITTGTVLTFQLTVMNTDALTTDTDTISVFVSKADTFSADGHDGIIRSVSISRDGRLAVSGGADGTVRLWNANTAEEILFASTSSDDGRPLGSHDGAVYAVAISADGNRAISGGIDGTIRLWDVVAGTEIRYAVAAGSQTRSLGRAGIWVYAVALNKDGSRAASGGFDGKVRFWNTQSTGAGAGTEITYDIPGTSDTLSLGLHENSSVYAVALSDDGSSALSGGSDGRVDLWNTTTGENTHVFSGEEFLGPVYGVSLSHDGMVAAAGGADNKVHVWNVNGTGETHELMGHGADVSSVSLSLDKSRVLSSGGDGTVRFWNIDLNDADSGAEIHALRRHTDYVWSASLGGNTGIALSGGGDGTLNFWDTSSRPADTSAPFATKEPDVTPDAGNVVRQELGEHKEIRSGASLSADGRIALSGSNGFLEIPGMDNYSLHLWDATSGALLRTMSGHTANINGVSLSADGQRALSSGQDGTAHFWDTTTGTLLRTINFANGSIHGNSLNANGRFALVWDDGNTPHLWDTTKGELPSSLRGDTSWHVGMALSADGRLALGTLGSTVRLWDITSGTILRNMNGHTDRVNDVSLSADGRLALSGGDDDSVRLWDATTGDLLRTMSSGDSVHGVALSADGRLALSGGADNFLRLWDTTTGNLLRFIYNHHLNRIEDVSLSGDGSLALSQSAHTLNLWHFGRSRTAGVPLSGTAVAGVDQSVGSGTRVTLDGSGSSDPQGDEPIAYFWRQTAGPAVMLSANNNAEVIFTAPAVTESTTLGFELTVTDSHGLIATDETSITVNLLADAAAGDDQTVVTGVNATLDGSASRGPFGGDVTFSWRQVGEGPRVTLSDATAERPTFTTPTVTTDTILTFSLTVMDSRGLTAMDEVSVLVHASLTAIAGNDQNSAAGATVTLDGSNSGAPGGAPITYSWTQTSGPTVLLSAANAVMPTFTAPMTDPWLTMGTRLTFQLTVRDNNGLTHADSISIFVGKEDIFSVRSAHDGIIRGVSVSRDGSLAVSGGIDGTVRLWDANSGEEMKFDTTSPEGGRVLGRHEGAVHAVAISADGSRAISGGIDGTVRLWDTGIGTEVRYAVAGQSNMRSLGRDGIWIYAVALNADGSRAVSGGFDGKVRFWNTQVTGPGAGEEITYAVAGGSDMHSLGGHTFIDDRGLPRIQGDTAIPISVYAVALNDDGSRALSGGADGTVRVWNTINGAWERTLRDDNPMGQVYGVFLSGDGRTAVSGSADNNVHVWNVDNGIETHELIGHTADVSSVSLNTNKTHVLSSGGDGTVRFWNVNADDAENGTEIRALRRHTDYVWSASLSGDGGVALSGGSDGTLNFWDTATMPTDTPEPFATLEPNTALDRIHDVASRELGTEASLVSMSANGHLALSVSTSDGAGLLHLWNTITGEPLHTLSGHQSYIDDASLSADGRIVLSRDGHQSVRVWDATSGGQLRVIDDFALGAADDVSLSADGHFVISMSDRGSDNGLSLWDTTTGELVRTMGDDTVAGPGVSLSADGRLALSAGGNNLLLWDTSTGTLLHTMRGHDDLVGSVALSADGQLALSGSWDNTLRLWNTTTGEHLHTMSGHTDWINGVSLSADGRLALSGSTDGTVRLWNATTGDPLRIMSGSMARFSNVRLSANGRFALWSNSRDIGGLRRIGRSYAANPPSTNSAAAGTDQPVASGAEVTLTGSGRSDAGDGKPIAYFWRQTTGTDVTLSAIDTATTTFTAPSVATSTTLNFVLTITDALGLTASDEVSVTVSPP